MTTTLDSFLVCLRDSQLLSTRQLDEVTHQLRHQFTDTRTLARELLQRNWLTAYQVNQLIGGQNKSLKIGPYVVQQRLGEGGGGQVFKAEHTIMKRPVALKVLRSELLTDGETRKRFEREIRVIGQISHPHVVQAHDAGTIGDAYFLAMEYIPGQDLSQLVRRSGPLSVVQASEYIRQAALALQHIHEHGLVHRDVKPSNLILSQPPSAMPADPERTAPLTTVVNPVGVVKLLDLGLARLLDPRGAEQTRSLTAKDSLPMGTLDYLAPEQALDFHEVDIRADIYSLGCTFYFLLTGQPPFPEG